MPDPTPNIEPLRRHHDRTAFDCGNQALTAYLQRQARQDLDKRAAVPFVLVFPGTKAVAGYYTLTSFQIDVGDLPADVTKRFPRYPLAPATLLGRLAVDRRYQGTGLGKTLLMDALDRSLAHSAGVASLAVVVDAIDDMTVSFYERYGFVRFPDHPSRLFLTMATIEATFA